MSNRIFLITMCFLLWSVVQAQASSKQPDPELESLIEMPISDLMNVVVSVASLEEENLIQSPAIVSSFKRKDMESMGLRSLKDILSFFPGFIINEPFSGPPVVQVRGLVDVNNQKILFLLDDTPYWLAASGNIPLLAVPFELIEKVEVIRGPGSVIYGTNATAGVIKVVTRKDDTDSVDMTLGEYSTARVSGYQRWDHSGGTNHVTRVGYELQVSDGYNASIKNALTGPPGESPTENGYIPRSEESKSVYVSHRYKNLNTFLHASETQKSGASFGTIQSRSIYRENALMLHGDYNINREKITTTIFAEYNSYYSTIEIDDLLVLWDIPGDGEFSYTDNGKDNYRFRGGFQSRVTISEPHTLLFGVEYEKRSTGDYLLLDDNNGNNLNAVPVPDFSTTPGYNGILIHGADDSEENTIYVQSDSSINNYRFLLGVRYVDNNKSGSKTIPRLSAVYQLDQQKSLKFLYSVGFNSPTFRQNAGIGAFGTKTNIDLEAETVRSYDLAYNFTSNGSLFVANLFFIQARDIIGSVNGVFVNSEDFERSGFELDYQVAKKPWLFYSNLSYLQQGDGREANDPTSAYAPRWNFSTGSNYKIDNSSSIGGSLRVISERNNTDVNSLLNLDYQFEKPNYTVYASLLNVLNEDIIHPDIRTIGTTDIKVQAYPERSVFAGVKFQY